MGQPEREREERICIPPFESLMTLTYGQINEFIDKLMEKLKEKRKSQILCMYYTEENEVMMDQADVLTVYTLLRQHGKCERLDIFLHSTGGDIHTAYQIAKLCRKYCSHFSVIVPEYAMSAATLLCLGADEILLSKIGHLGPLDPIVKIPKLGWLPAYAIRMAPKILEKELETEKGIDPRLKAASIVYPIASQIDPYLFTTFANVPALAVTYGSELLQIAGKTEEEARRIITRLVYGYPVHGQVIDFEGAKNLNLNVKELEPDQESISSDILLCLKALDKKHKFEGEPLSKPIIKLY